MARKRKTIDEDGNIEIEQENIIVQLRKVINLNGNKIVTFNDQSKLKLTPSVAYHVLNKYEQIKRSADKEALAKALTKSSSSFQEVVQDLYGSNPILTVDKR